VKTTPIIITIGFVYIAIVGALYLQGAGIVAAYLTIPGWLAIGAIALLIASLAPESPLAEMMVSWGGNLTALLLSAAINVAGVYLLARQLSKTGRSAQSIKRT
jgi:hypothetical protein